MIMSDFSLSVLFNGQNGIYYYVKHHIRRIATFNFGFSAPLKTWSHNCLLFVLKGCDVRVRGMSNIFYPWQFASNTWVNGTTRLCHLDGCLSVVTGFPPVSKMRFSVCFSCAWAIHCYCANNSSSLLLGMQNWSLARGVIWLKQVNIIWCMYFMHNNINISRLK